MCTILKRFRHDNGFDAGNVKRLRCTEDFHLDLVSNICAGVFETIISEPNGVNVQEALAHFGPELPIDADLICSRRPSSFVPAYY